MSLLDVSIAVKLLLLHVVLAYVTEITGSSILSAALGSMQISLIVPAFNEQVAIGDVLRAAHAYFRERGYTHEIILVDDGSTDDTAGCALRMAEQCGMALRVVRHEIKRGYGAALRTGFAEARSDILLYMDGDGQYDIRAFDQFAPLLEYCDVVSGVRVIRGDGWIRRIPSRLFRILCYVLFRVYHRDINCGFKALRRSTLDGITLTSDNFCIAVELLWKLRCKGKTVRFVPVEHRPRHGGKSSVNAGSMLRSVGELIRLRLRGSS